MKSQPFCMPSGPGPGPMPFLGLPDNGGRRSETDRRRFSYTAYIPERRSGFDRRCLRDRRRRPRAAV